MTRLRWLFATLLITSFAVGCGSEDDGMDPPDDDPLIEPPPPPEGGLQLMGKKFTVPAGTERFVCYETDFVASEDIWVNESKVYQMDGGHHVIAFWRSGTAPTDPEPHECDELDMSDIRMVGTGSGWGAGVTLPEGKAMLVPKGARIAFQAHYLNTSPEEIEVQDAMNLALLDQDDVDEKVGAFAHVDLTFELPPHQDTTRTMRCELPYDMNPVSLFPHMHEFGFYFKSHIERAQSEEVLDLFDVDWVSDFRDDFPDYDNVETLQFKKGDILETSCTWRNTEDESLLFPREMCVTFFMFYPSDTGAQVYCDESGFVDDV